MIFITFLSIGLSQFHIPGRGLVELTRVDLIFFILIDFF
jgi:hypothetical protein